MSRFHSIHFHGVSSMPSRPPLLPQYDFVSHIPRTIIGLPLLFIQEHDKMRRPSANQSLQSIIVGHKGGHIKIPTKNITHNNNVRTQNMNLLWHTIGTRVHREIPREPFGPVMFTARCHSSSFKNLILSC
jgi:hypothetical protein